MIQDWRKRLLNLLDERELSMRDVSIKAGVSHGYLHGILKDSKDPGVESLIKVCDYLGITLSWLLYGYEIDPTSENLLLEIQRADQVTRDALLTLLRSKANQNQPPA